MFKDGKRLNLAIGAYFKMKTLSEVMQEIVDDICSNYCKFPERYINDNQGMDEDELEDKLHEEICSNCPFNRI